MASAALGARSSANTPSLDASSVNRSHHCNDGCSNVPRFRLRGWDFSAIREFHQARWKPSRRIDQLVEVKSHDLMLATHHFESAHIDGLRSAETIGILVLLKATELTGGGRLRNGPSVIVCGTRAVCRRLEQAWQRTTCAA
jgi:hypothetical protein